MNTTFHAICPYDLFSDELRPEYYALLPGGDCGAVSSDVVGSITGQWFVNEDVSPTKLEELGVYIGSKVQTGGGRRIELVFGTDAGERHLYEDEPSYLDPAEVADSHCYELAEPGKAPLFVFFQLASEHAVRVASGSGSCPGSFPAVSDTFYR